MQGKGQNMIVNLKEIKDLIFESNITAYEIEKQTGVFRTTISNLRNNKVNLEDTKLFTIIKLQEYINNLKK